MYGSCQSVMGYQSLLKNDMWIWKENCDIDKAEWDAYLSLSEQPFVEHSSWYLDICSQNWGSFFDLSSTCRIPIPYSKKLGFLDSVTRPPYLQRLKIIHEKSVIEIDQKIPELINTIKERFSCGHLSWDYPTNKTIPRANYLLTSEINTYNQSQKRNLSKSAQNQILYERSKNFDILFNWINKNGENYVYQKDFKNKLFYNLVSELITRDYAFIIFAKNAEDSIIGAAIFTKYLNRYVFFLSFNSGEGKKKGAMVGLIHYVQNQLMNPDDILDLEGSDIPGVATFYEGFGAVMNPYHVLTWNSNFLCKLYSIFQK